MRIQTLSKPFLLYTGLLGLLTVSLVYLITHSGFLMLGLAGLGLFLFVLGGATVGPMSASGVEHAEDAGAGLMVEDTGMWPHTYTQSSLRLILLFYGLGVFLWSLLVLLVLNETLV